MFQTIWSRLRPTFEIKFFQIFGRGHQRLGVDTIFLKTIKCDAEMFEMYLPYSKHLKLTFGRPQSCWVHRLNTGCKLGAEYEDRWTLGDPEDVS